MKELLPIYTERLKIIETSIDDIDLILKMDKQESTQKYLGGIKDKSREERIEFLKNKKNSLTVLLDDITIKYLEEYITTERCLPLNSPEPLFTCSRGDTTKPLSKNGFYAAIKRLAQNSELDKNVYPHLFRKTTGSNIIKRGGTTDDVDAYLGHKPQGVAKKHYIHYSEKYVEDIFSNYVQAV